MKILVLGEIIGIPVVKVLRKKLPDIIDELEADFVIANADGASDGFGVLAETASQLLQSRIDILTSGDFVYNKKNIKDFLNTTRSMVRPFNLPTESPGRGYTMLNVNSSRICIVSLLGRNSFQKIFPSDPYKSADYIIDKVKDEANIIIVDFHGGTTSEIQSMQWHLAGRVSIAVGSHMRVLTSDARVIEDYTGIITGTGYCGGYQSICGLSKDIEALKIRTARFMYSKVDKENTIIQGILADVDEQSGKVNSMELVNRHLT